MKRKDNFFILFLCEEILEVTLISSPSVYNLVLLPSLYKLFSCVSSAILSLHVVFFFSLPHAESS